MPPRLDSFDTFYEEESQTVRARNLLKSMTHDRYAYYARQEHVPISFRTWLYGVYLLTLARWFEPQKYLLAKQVSAWVNEERARESS